jgi:hypothetical protein
MGRLHDTEPLCGEYLERTDAFPDMIDKDLRPSSGKGVEARIGKETQNTGNRLS